VPGSRSAATWRAVLLGGAAAATVAGLGGSLPRALAARGAGQPSLPEIPSLWGSSPEIRGSDSLVLWTRLAVDPIAGNGLGGTPAHDTRVQ